MALIIHSPQWVISFVEIDPDFLCMIKKVFDSRKGSDLKPMSLIGTVTVLVVARKMSVQKWVLLGTTTELQKPQSSKDNTRKQLD